MGALKKLGLDWPARRGLVAAVQEIAVVSSEVGLCRLMYRALIVRLRLDEPALAKDNASVR
jgi:hypothetical protein